MFPVENRGGSCSKSRNVDMITLNQMEKVIKGKALKGLKRFNEIKDQLRTDAMEMKINESDDNKRLKEIHGGWALTRDQMRYLRSKPYTYNASAGSYLELLFLQKFWVWLIRFVPLSVMPCVLTCAGLVINVVTSCAVLYYSPDARSEVPSWAFILCAIGVFLYQTLDALDGKQCYRIQCTQIEEMYDHGCDAVSITFVTLAVACAGQLGKSPPLLFALFISSVIAFYTSHWLCHVTHQMVFGKIDVSEGQCLMIIIHIFTAIYGQRVWHCNLCPQFIGLDIRPYHLLAYLTILSMLRSVYINLTMIYGSPTPLDKYVTIPRRKTNIHQPVWPVVILTTIAMIAYLSGYFHVSPSLFVFTFGFAFAKVTLKLVMMNCSNGNMEVWDTSMIAPLLMALNSRHIAILHPKTALICAFVYSLMDFARYFTYASWDLRVALNLWIFTLKYPPGHPNNRKDSEGFYVNGLNNEQVLNNVSKSQTRNDKS